MTHEIVGERRDLLEPGNGDVGNTLVLALLQERVVHLTGTQDVAADLFRSDQVLRVGLGEVALEVSVADHLRQLRARLGMAEERLREEDNERLAEVTVDLATEDVEVVRRRPRQNSSLVYETLQGRRWRLHVRGVDDLHVAVLVLALDLLW